MQVDFLLLGEVHDNAEGHNLRLQWLEQWGRVRLVSLAFEQFDAERQADLDGAIARWKATGRPASPEMTRSIAEAGHFDFKGWKWELYEPVLEWALDRNVPIFAANVSRREMGRVMKGEVAAIQPDHWEAAQQEALMQEVREGHCNLLPESQLPRMVDAQLARDREMATVMVAAYRLTGRPVALLAGNGHVRNDLAVPVWLHQLAPEARVMSIAVLESGQPTPVEPRRIYDQIYWVPSELRSDPCELLRKKMNSPRK